MTFTLISKAEAQPIMDALIATALSIKPDNTAVAAPGNGAVLIAGYDSVGAVQRSLDVAALDTGAISESRIGLLVRAAVTGQDLAAGAGSKNVPISADLANAAGGRSLASIESLYVNAIVGGQSSGNYFQTAITAAATATSYTLNRLAVDSIIRGDDGATYSAVATRATVSGLAVAINRLQVDATVRGYDPIGGLVDACLLSQEVTGVDRGSLLVTEARARGYWASIRGRRYVIKSPNLTGVAAATSLTTTTPTFLIVCGATKAIIVRRIKVNLPVVGTSTTFRLLVKTDTANRFSAGGTSRTPATMNNGNIVASGLAQFLEAPTATAEGGGTLDIDCDSNQLVAGSELLYEPEDGLIVVKNGSLLVYVITATGAATVDYTIEFEEAQVQ